MFYVVLVVAFVVGAYWNGLVRGNIFGDLAQRLEDFADDYKFPKGISISASPLIAVGMILWLVGLFLGSLIWLLLALLQKMHYYAVFVVAVLVTIFVFSTGDPLTGTLRSDLLITTGVLGFGYFTSGMYHELMN
ncbi:MAG: hypothetical protein UY40_C0026G0005 [candidate division CPR1 bacterium GW2011_GWC1_49_13]|uniref:Uncharacterized protein n=1 Tax=candidate division CPR1 bacterium GW2011_GWC1_49_13 TaxID=1618342 RepID=A0A0G1XRN6_9BACT|nr:MAG: hypothetical protein UY40_C0026G0005 [candidate division CPR1 bacterium GW2011_GWC1_49_13]